jgi:uncharacterized protein (DUF1810 family)
VVDVDGDGFDLERFVEAQDGGVHERALGELRRGRKTSHWMWFVFPQVAGLGASAMNRRYAISSLAEARAYLDHPVLGPRLRSCTDAVLALPAGVSADEVFGAVDARKLRSSMTLFLRAAASPSEEERFAAVLQRFFGGEADAATDERLA